MHCYQQSPKWQELQSTWEFREKMPIQADSRAHSVHHQVHLNHRVYPDTPVKYMLKQEVVELLGYKSSGTELLKGITDRE